MKLNHINIKANREKLEEVKDFYCNTLGFTVGDRPNVSSFGYWLYSEGKALIHLSETDEDIQMIANGHLDHIAFEASGLQTIIGGLTQNNVNYTSNHVSDLDLTQLFIFDPVGNKIEINFQGEKL